MKLNKIHRTLVFEQRDWLKLYINFNTEKRKQATNDFEMDLFKPMNNSVLGKTMTNLYKNVKVKLINNSKQLIKLTASPAFDSFRIFSKDLAAFNIHKTTLLINRPIYDGFAILDLSKILMYSFHYNFIKNKYGSNVKLLFTDTDSLCNEIKTHNLYEDFYSES